MEKERKQTIDSIKQEYVSLIWTHKIFEVQADLYSVASLLFRIVNILFMVLSTCGIISLFFVDETAIKITTSILSAFSLALVLINYEFPFRERIERYKKHATQFLQKRDDFRIMLSKYNDGILSLEQLLEEHHSLSSGIHIMYFNAPVTSRLAVKIAKRRLLFDKESTVEQEEIKLFLRGGKEL